MEDKREYSEIEVEIAKNLLKEGYGWIARDESNTLYAYKDRPEKGENGWMSVEDWLLSASRVIPLFKSIRWEDDEPVSLRDIVPQILTDEEREWLRTVVKPFRDRLKAVKVFDGVYYGRYITFIIDPPEGRIEDIEENVEYVALPVSEDGFEVMEHYKHYTPEELGI